MKAEFLKLSDIYLCEVGFTTTTYLKGKYNNALNICAPLQVALSSIEPQLQKVIEKNQANTSHQRIKIKRF